MTAKAFRAITRNSTRKTNVVVYKDLNIEFVIKFFFVTRTQCKNAIKPYISRAHCLFYACVRNDLYPTAIELHEEFRDRLQTLIYCAHVRKFHDR